MSDDNALAGENPFRRLDKRLFPRGEAKRSPAHGRTLPKPAQDAARIAPGEADSLSFAETLSPDENADAATFLAAMSGTTRLGSPKGSALRKHLPKDAPCTDLKNSVLMADAVKPGQFPRKLSPAYVPTQSSFNSAETGDDQTFTAAMRGVTPLPGKGRSVTPEVVPSAPPPAEGDDNPLQDFMEGKIEFALAATDEYIEGHVLGLDLITVGKLQAGRYSPEAHLDLHGLNAVQAFQTLVGFIKGAYLKGQRTLLVVPGRGRNSPHGMPILRTKVQEWLTQEPFRRVVLAFCTARPADGGPGALYVLMRKNRTNHGKVYWDRKPTDPDLL